MDARFFLYINNVEHVITEPVGFDGFTTKLKRDANSHGLAFEFSETLLSFDGVAFNLIKEQYILLGTNAIIFFKAETKCSDIDDFEQIYYGQLEMTTYNDVTEQYNHIDVNVSQQSDEVTIANRKDQEVALNTRIGFDGAALSEYPAIDKDVTLQPMDVLLTSQANGLNVSYTCSAPVKDVKIHYDVCTGNNYFYKNLGAICYSMVAQKYGELGTVSINGNTFLSEGDNPFDLASIIKVMASDIGVQLTENIQVNIRLKGTITISAGKWTPDIYLMTVFRPKLYVEGTGAYNFTGEENIKLGYCDDIESAAYDWSLNVSIPAYLLQGKRIIVSSNTEIYWYLGAVTGGTTEPVEFQVASSEDSSFLMRSHSMYGSTTAKAAMIHETASRIIEAITDGNLAVKSDFFARPDSNVKHQKTNVSLANTSGNIGYGSMFCLLNGYQIRKSLRSDGSAPYISIKWKDLIDNLQAIYNVGYGIEYDEAVGANVLRIEPWTYFYNSEVIFTIISPNKKERKTNTAELYSKLEIGYSTWEAEIYNGQDAFLTGRTYRTKTNVIDNTLSKICKWIADGYAFEATRRKTLDSDTKDFKYDEKVFCLILQDDGLNVVYTSRNGVENGENLISPSTVYNAMISPARIALRWANRCMQLLTPSMTKAIYFLSGTGNILAKGRVVNDGVTPENTVINENQDLTVAQHKTAIRFNPFLKAETMPVEYPVSKEEWNIIRSNPKGRVLVDGEITYIKELVYNPVEGIGKFLLIPSYETE